MGKSNPKNTIVRFVNRKSCYAALSKKLDLRLIDKVKLGFPEANLFFNENLTPYDQKLAWKCREPKRAGKIPSTWSSKEIIKLRCTMNVNVQFLLRMKLNYQIFILILSFEKGKNRLESRFFILSYFVSAFYLGGCEKIMSNVSVESWDISLRSSWCVLYNFTAFIFSYFLLCLLYLLNFLYLLRTHQVDLIDLHLILCFLFLVFAKRFDKLLPNINCSLK